MEIKKNLSRLLLFSCALTISCLQDEPANKNSISLSITANDMHLYYDGTIDTQGNLLVKLESVSTNDNSMLDTERLFDITDPDYKQKIGGWLEEYAYDLHTKISMERAAKIVSALQAIVETVYYEKGTETFRDEKYKGLFYLKAVFGSISRSSHARKGSNLNVPPVGTITPYQGYITGLTPFYAQEEMLLFITPFRAWLNNHPQRLTTQDVANVRAALPTYGQMTYKQYFGITAPVWLQGTNCGCCGNYNGGCFYAHPICYIHDYLCQSCTPSWFCFSGCVATPC